MNQHYLELRGRIHAKGWSIADIARKTGVSESHMNNILCVRTYPKIDLCYDILKAIDAEPSEIYTLFPPGGVTPAREATLTAAKERQNRKVIRIGRA